MSPKPERFELRLDPEQITRIDTWAAKESMSRAEAVRRLIDQGLAAGSHGSVHFSDGEKILILMMADVYKYLNIKNPEVNSKFLGDAIYGGHYWAPKWEMQGAFHDHVDTPEDVRHVVDVLDLWTFVEEAYEKFSASQKQQITDEVGSWATNIVFPGFDGNNEASQLSIAQFLTNKMDRFTRFKDRGLNSHCATFERYSRMVRLFEPMRKTLIGHGLSVEQVITLLKR